MGFIEKEARNSCSRRSIGWISGVAAAGGTKLGKLGFLDAAARDAWQFEGGRVACDETTVSFGGEIGNAVSVDYTTASVISLRELIY